MKRLLLFLILLILMLPAQAQNTSKYYLLADRLFDGDVMHEGWAVVVENDKIVAAGPKEKVKEPVGAIRIVKPGCTLMPGLIEGHAHMFLYPYNITSWDNQVLKETDSYRMARATVHALNTLRAGITTARDLGTEGAGFSDVALKHAIDDGIIPGPRLLTAGRAIVVTGSYGPKGYDDDMHIMHGAEQADGDQVIKVVRDQIGHGVDLIKVYADYNWGPDNEARPTFSVAELKAMVETAASSGRPVVAHAVTKEGITRAVIAGVETIEHGDFLDLETARLMKEHHVTYIPTLAVGEMMAYYHGWTKGSQPDPSSVVVKKKSFKDALQSGVAIGMGGDVGVFAHGENVLEMELMAEYGMNLLDVLKAATSVNARAFHLEEQVGSIREGLKADLVFFEGNPSKKISDLRKVKWVMKNGLISRND